MEIPDDLYRQVKAKSALEGRPVREVAIELFRRYIRGEEPPDKPAEPGQPRLIDGEPAPPWFGVLHETARRVGRHDMDAIRESIGRGITTEREL